ncbi:MAG TPA: hypothetical protein VFG68_19715 [Fimbriiglobus sp.]|nr:hypothetical protein [Fimbriiglobus sp.]
MSAQNSRTLIAVGMVTAIPFQACGQPPNTPAQFIDRVRHEFPAVWKRATAGPYISDCLFEQHRVTDKEERLVEAITFKYRRSTAGRYLNSMELKAFNQPGAKPYDSRVNVINPRYEFKLRKPFGGTDWLLSGWQLAGENKPDYRPPVSYTPETLHLFSHLAFRGYPLSTLLASPGSKVISVEASPIDGSLARVVFSFTDSSRPGFVSSYSGWLDLEPAAGWCVRQYDCRMTLDAQGKTVSKRFICTNEYEKIDGSLSVLTRVQCIDSDIKPDGGEINRQRRTFRFDTRYVDSVPDSEFTLTAFGLREPVGLAPEQTATPVYIWLLAAAGMFGVLALLFRWLVRRRSAAHVAV